MESGLIYLRNRYYDPKTGRFTSENSYWNTDNMIYGDNGETGFPDFAAISQSSNLYVYGMNNPVKYTDPSGKAGTEVASILLRDAFFWRWCK